MIATWAASLTLVGLAGGLIDSHRRAYSRFVRGEDPALAASDGRARAYAWRQYRRRMFASSILAVVGVLIAVRPAVPQTPLWVAAYLALMVVGCLLVVTLGGLDALATSRYFRRAQRMDRTSTEKLSEALEQARRQGPGVAPPEEDQPRQTRFDRTDG